jgi:glycosyltransferase involved in cell wall biosynthesis
MKLFEYMACKTVVLASNHGQMKELFSDGVDAYLCDNSPQDILMKILQIERERNDAESVARAGWLRIKEDFNWELNAKRTVDVFFELLAGKKSNGKY